MLTVRDEEKIKRREMEGALYCEAKKENKKKRKKRENKTDVMG